MREVVLEKKYTIVDSDRLKLMILNGTCNAIIEEILKNPDCLTPDYMETYEIFHTDSIYAKILEKCLGAELVKNFSITFPETRILDSLIVPEANNTIMMAQDLCKFIYDQIINNGMYADYYLSILMKFHPLDEEEELLHYKAQICKRLLEVMEKIQNKMLGNLK